MQGRLVGRLAIGVPNRIGRRGQRADRQLLTRRAADADSTIGQLQISRAGFEQLGGEHQHFFAHRVGRESHRITGGHQRPTRIGPRTPVEAAGVAGHHAHIGHIAAKLVGHDLGKARVVALSLAGQSCHGQHPSAWLDTHVRALVGPDARTFDIRGEPQAEVAGLGARHGLFRAKADHIDHLLGQRQAGRVIAAVVARRRAILKRQPDIPRELVGRDEIAPPHLVRFEP